MSGLRNRASPAASASGASGTSKEAGLSEPRQCGDRETRSRALTTLVEAVHYAAADVGSIPTVSTPKDRLRRSAKGRSQGGFFALWERENRGRRVAAIWWDQLAVAADLL